MRPVEVAARELITHHEALLKALLDRDRDEQDRLALLQQNALKNLKASLAENPKALQWCEQGGWQDAFLGNFADENGVRFCITHYPSNWLRGQWQLIIDVEDMNHEWPTMDHQDQCMRYYFTEQQAKEAAQCLADIMVEAHSRKAAKTS